MYNYSAHGISICSDLELPEMNEVSAQECSLIIHQGKINLPDLEPVKCWRQGRQAYFGTDDSKGFLHWDGIGNFAMNGGEKIVYEKKSDDDALFRLYLLSEAFGIALFQKGYFLLHASAIEINGKAIVFMGTPGAGKSTTVAAFAKLGYSILADDMVVIKIGENKRPYIIPSYPSVKIWEPTVLGLSLGSEKLRPLFEGSKKQLLTQNENDKSIKESIPLSDIYVLSPNSAKMEATSMDAQQSFLALTNYFPLPPQALREDTLQQHFDQASNIVKHTKIWNLHRTDNFQDLVRFSKNISSALMQT